MNVNLICNKILLLGNFFQMINKIPRILSDTIDVIDMHKMIHFQNHLFSAEVEC